ncbi:MAG TPA: lysophospholipid acyltransferase family protein [Hanamia sp.]|nr:lysophospholipid acyltransferase family protein [Hanamia sp.]
MKSFFAKIFAVWALLIFTVTLLCVIIPMWLIGIFNEPKRTEAFRKISKGWMQLFFFLSGCRLKITGKRNFESGKNYIVVSNHNSFFDVPVLTPFIPRANKTIAKAELAKIPLFGLIYKRGSVLLDRNDKKSRQDSFKKMRKVLEMGMDMCIYPEGTRNRTILPLKEFHDGAFRLAVETGTPIIPALIFNTRKILPPGVFYFWPGKIELHFLPPVLVNKEENYVALKERIHFLMAEYYLKHQ